MLFFVFLIKFYENKQNMTDNVLFAFALTLFAGLSTGIGSAMALLAKSTNKNFLSIALGFSAGVMVYVSFMEILPKANDSLSLVHGEKLGSWYTAAAFFSGVLFIGIIDRVIPSYENPHEVRSVEDMNEPTQKNKKLIRMGLFSALAIAIHNFPEGIATFSAALINPQIAIPIAVAIAIHNIPEGIAVSIPIYHATGSRKKAFFLSFLSGLAEPLGAAIGYIVLQQFLDETVMGIIFASVAGIMVFISLDELLPTAKEYGRPHSAIYGLIGGMAVMALSLLLFI